MGVEEVKWGKGTVRAANYFFCQKGKENHQLLTGILFTIELYQRVKSWSLLLTRVIYSSQRSLVSYCSKSYARTEKKSDESTDGFYGEFEQVSDCFPYVPYENSVKRF